ncbi:hypothetical protein BJF96_g9621 [Verticillium dahliae]|nr:hypothetical protein BJF96_g9621 [Verticillium dahliae]PNH73063.1 hypothetical protein VD0001_g4495 [Verticillium dahliae]
MISGTHNGKAWYELLTLMTDDEEQVDDWLDILGSTPLPPLSRAPIIIQDSLPSTSSPRTKATDVPVGGRLRASVPPSPTRGSASPEPSTPAKRPTPSRYHSRAASLPTTPITASAPALQNTSPDRTPTQQSYNTAHVENDRSRPLKESMRPGNLSLDDATASDVSSDATTYREDGAPPPPVHREFSKSPAPEITLESSRIKRRTSSPLKHEYLPSDHSSVTDDSFTESSDDDYSDDDSEDGTEVPETELGVSIKDSIPLPAPGHLLEGSMVSESLCSVTPSSSASQAGLPRRNSGTPDTFTKYIATLSYWSDKKGVWKDISGEPCSVIVGPGIIEAYSLVIDQTNAAEEQSKPLVALDLTPLVLLRQSTVLDLEIRSAVQEHCQHQNLGGGNFRFRCTSSTECYNLYMAVHHARLNNQKFIQLENDARFKNFGERQAPVERDDDGSSRRRSWFGRKNSYRASTRAPSQSQEGGSIAPSSSISAASFLKRLTGGGNLSFNIARSSVDKNSQYGNNSIYASESGSSGGAASPRAPSLYSSARTTNGQPLSADNIRIRLHLLVTATKWEDYGNCSLQIRRPPPGWHQELRANHGLEKRITVTTLPRKDSETPRIILDAVLGSGCFTPMGSRGIICGIWEELRTATGEVGIAPATGGAAGSIKKWCLQCASVGEAQWVLRLVHQEVMRA